MPESNPYKNADPVHADGAKMAKERGEVVGRSVGPILTGKIGVKLGRMRNLNVGYLRAFVLPSGMDLTQHSLLTLVA
jgi:hypothetical protein